MNKLLLLLLISSPIATYAGHATDGERGNEMPSVFDPPPKELSILGNLNSGHPYKIYLDYFIENEIYTHATTIAIDPVLLLPNKQANAKNLEKYNKSCASFSEKNKRKGVTFNENEKILVTKEDHTLYAIKRVDKNKSILIERANDSQKCFEEKATISNDILFESIRNHFDRLYKRMMLYTSQLDFIDSISLQELQEQNVSDQRAIDMYLIESKISKQGMINHQNDRLIKDLRYARWFIERIKEYNLYRPSSSNNRFKNYFEASAYLYESAILEIYGENWGRILSRQLASISERAINTMNRSDHDLNPYSITKDLKDRFEFFNLWLVDYKPYLEKLLKNSTQWIDARTTILQNWRQSDMKAAYCELKAKELNISIVTSYIVDIASTAHISDICE